MQYFILKRFISTKEPYFTDLCAHISGLIGLIEQRGITPFAVHYEIIRIHLREKATNSAKIHSLARKSEHLRVNQIQ